MREWSLKQKAHDKYFPKFQKQLLIICQLKIYRELLSLYLSSERCHGRTMKAGVNYSSMN